MTLVMAGLLVRSVWLESPGYLHTIILVVFIPLVFIVIIVIQMCFLVITTAITIVFYNDDDYYYGDCYSHQYSGYCYDSYG